VADVSGKLTIVHIFNGEGAEEALGLLDLSRRER
jgi:hypothetical protein